MMNHLFATAGNKRRKPNGKPGFSGMVPDSNDHQNTRLPAGQFTKSVLMTSFTGYEQIGLIIPAPNPYGKKILQEGA